MMDMRSTGAEYLEKIRLTGEAVASRLRETTVEFRRATLSARHPSMMI